jgi:micrococcal nuclease
MKEVFYFVAGIMLLASFVVFILGLIKPSAFAGLLKEKATRKNLALYAVALFFSAAVLSAVFEPDSVKQARLDKQNQQSVAEQAAPEVAQQEVLEKQTESITPELFSITRVVDGDTIEVEIENKNERVRLVGIDAPEISSSECYGAESTAGLKSLLNDKKVSLEADELQGDRDQYGRLLRFVFLEDGTHINEKLVAEGFAFESLYTSQPHKYRTDLLNAQTDAQNQKKGLWSKDTCDGKRQKPQPQQQSVRSSQTTTAVPKPSTSSTQTAPKPTTSCKIKGNISSSGEKIYHMPGQQYYDRTIIDTSKGERWFCTEAEAVNAGWRKSKR